MKENKHKSPLWWLLGFPIVDVLAVIVFVLGAILDSRLYENATGLGHPAPVFTLLFSFAAAGIFIIGNIIVLIILIVALVMAGKRKREGN